MTYNKRGYIIRARNIQQIVASHYEPGNQQKCLKSVWRRYIHPQFGLSYRSFLQYCKVDLPPQSNMRSTGFGHDVAVRFTQSRTQAQPH